MGRRVAGDMVGDTVGGHAASISAHHHVGHGLQQKLNRYGFSPVWGLVQGGYWPECQSSIHVTKSAERKVEDLRL